MIKDKEKEHSTH